MTLRQSELRNVIYSFCTHFFFILQINQRNNNTANCVTMDVEEQEGGGDAQRPRVLPPAPFGFDEPTILDAAHPRVHNLRPLYSSVSIQNTLPNNVDLLPVNTMTSATRSFSRAALGEIIFVKKQHQSRQIQSRVVNGRNNPGSTSVQYDIAIYFRCLLGGEDTTLCVLFYGKGHNMTLFDADFGGRHQLLSKKLYY